MSASERVAPPDIRRIEPGDAADVLAAADLFDAAPRPEWTERFLAEPGHHLLIAYVAGVPAGFVTGVETTHPDKGTEMFLYELGVAAAYRRRGIGRGLVAALRQVAVARGCYGMWVAIPAGDEPAEATYRSAGASPPEPGAILSWEWDRR